MHMGEPQRDSFFIDQQNLLRERLTDENLPSALIEQVIASGYFAWGIRDFGPGEGRPAVMDSYYGNKMAGLIEIGEFVEYLRNRTARRLPAGVSTYKVRNTAEALAILSQPQHARFSGRMSFRGQTTDYHITRPVPNPRAAGEDRRERMIVPSWWRPWINKDPAERIIESDRRLFSSPMLVAPLLYRDIEGWRGHIAPADSAGGDGGGVCEICALMEARRADHMSSGAAMNEAPLLEQHDGMPTIGLDVTFDPATAFFFRLAQLSGRRRARGLRARRARQPPWPRLLFCLRVAAGQGDGVPGQGHQPVQEPAAGAAHPPALRTAGFSHQRDCRGGAGPACGVSSRRVVRYVRAAIGGVPFPRLRGGSLYDALLELRERLPKFWGSVVEWADL
jgi:hypothetical protein